MPDSLLHLQTLPRCNVLLKPGEGNEEGSVIFNEHFVPIQISIILTVDYTYGNNPDIFFDILVLNQKFITQHHPLLVQRPFCYQHFINTICLLFPRHTPVGKHDMLFQSG
ncbi:hypothetical protein D3C71_1602100 [compost metagenome]